MLLKFIAQGVEDAKAGRTAPHDRVKKRFNAKLREMLAHAHAI
jgi:predicted transcriptional regulator